MGKCEVYLKKKKKRIFFHLMSKNDQPAAYPDKAVESVDGREIKVQAEKVKREDADYISLKRENSHLTLPLRSH